MNEYAHYFMAGVEAKPIVHDMTESQAEAYFSGFYKVNLYDKDLPQSAEATKLEDFPRNPFANTPTPPNRFIPCNLDNMPMIKWKKGGMTKRIAKIRLGAAYLAENLKGTNTVVIDIDGNHGETDWEVIDFFKSYTTKTMCHHDPANKDYSSFHLTFETDRLIPTTHHPYARIDILGNANNQARYFKNKLPNGLKPMELTEEVYQEIQSYLERRAHGQQA